jgi:hypothetical protein
MYTVSITLVKAGPLWGIGKAARGEAPVALGFAVVETPAFSPEPSRPQACTPEVVITTVSAK